MDDLTWVFISKLQTHFYLFVLVATRFLGTMSIFPIVSSSYFGRTFIKLCMALAFSMVIFPSLAIDEIEKLSTYLQILLIVKEYLVGVILGYLLSTPIWVIEAIGNLIDRQRGENLGAAVSHLTQTNDSSIAKLLLQSFTVYFISVNGVIFFVEFVYKSFALFPVNHFYPFVDMKMVGLYTSFFESFMLWTVLLSFPIILLMFLVEIVLGLLSTFLPQLNVTVLSMPIKSVVGMFVLILYVTNLYHFVMQHFLDKVKGIYV